MQRRGRILALSRPLDTEAERLFEGVVTRSLRSGLERRQLGVVESAAPAAADGSFAAVSELSAAADTETIDFILLAEYASRGSDLEIRLAWIEPQSGEVTEELTRRGRKDLVLDRIIRKALDDLLIAVESSLETLELKEMPAAADAPLAGDRTAGGGINAAQPDGAPQVLPGGAGQQPSQLLPVTEADPAKKRRFDLGVGCAPFVATGVASEYFKLGIMPIVNVSYLLHGKAGRFALGLYGGANVFTAAGDLASAQTFLIPMGASLRYEIGSPRSPSAVLGLAAGPALLLMNSSTAETLSGLTVFGRGSLGMRIPIGKAFAFLVEAGYDIYWEQPQPIMGFSPAVSTTIRF